VHQFTTQQVGIGGKRRNGPSLNTKSNLEYAQICSFKSNLPPESVPVQNRASGEGGKRRNELSLITQTQYPIMSMHKYVDSKATYQLRVHQLRTQQVGKGGTRRNKYLFNTISNLEYA